VVDRGDENALAAGHRNETRATGGGHIPGHNGGPDQSLDGADTSHDAFFS
jgi:hypothetical protein